MTFMVRKLLWTALIVLIFFCTTEWVCRLIPLSEIPVPPIGMQLQPHPTRIWSMTPGTQTQFGAEVRIDELGMRYSEIEPNTQIWLTLGDSSIFGHGLNDQGTLHDQLERTLKIQGNNVDVLCGATPGYSTLQTLDYLNETGWDLNPDVLILGNLWSDNNFDFFSRSHLDGNPSEPSEPNLTVAPKKFYICPSLEII